jgi:hypothetical protein
MSKVVRFGNTHPLLGTWGSLDENGTSVEYTVTQTPGGLSVSARDTYDGEVGVVSEVQYDGSTLEFTVVWSTGRSCRCSMKPGTRNQMLFRFTYTEHEHLQRRT